MADITIASRWGVSMGVQPAAGPQPTAPDADSDRMVGRLLGLRAAGCITLLMPGLLAGCGSTVSAADTTSSASGSITEAQATAYARAVNLRAGDIPGFTSNGNEIEAPKPGRLALEETRCSGVISPTRRIARVESTEFSARRASYSEIIKSAVEVWPTPALVAINNNPHQRSRSRTCFARFLRALHHRMNLERKGRMSIGPFTIKTVPNPLPGAIKTFLTRVDETRLLSSGAIRAHVYRDIFDFTTGPAEIELEAIGFGRPIPASTEARALQLLLDRAMAHAVQ
jgi:hypothetical protein